MKPLSAVLAVGLACALANADAVCAEESIDLTSFELNDGVVPVDNDTLDSQVGRGPDTATAISGNELGAEIAVILWDEAKPRGGVSAGGGHANASISISVGGN